MITFLLITLIFWAVSRENRTLLYLGTVKTHISLCIRLASDLLLRSLDSSFFIAEVNREDLDQSRTVQLYRLVRGFAFSHALGFLVIWLG